MTGWRSASALRGEDALRRAVVIGRLAPTRPAQRVPPLAPSMTSRCAHLRQSRSCGRARPVPPTGRPGSACPQLNGVGLAVVRPRPSAAVASSGKHTGRFLPLAALQSLAANAVVGTGRRPDQERLDGHGSRDRPSLVREAIFGRSAVQDLDCDGGQDVSPRSRDSICDQPSGSFLALCARIMRRLGDCEDCGFKRSCNSPRKSDSD